MSVTANDRLSSVAPLVGAWIEISRQSASFDRSPVAPLVGAWIEIHADRWQSDYSTSLPLWERGLK